MADAPNIAATKLEELLARMGLEGSVIVTDEATLNIKTEDPGTLIGHRGEGIRALQHVLRLMLIQEEYGESIVVDIDGYRQRQHEELQEMAKQKAEEVASSGRLVVLAPMSSYERRLVHVAIADHDAVETESLGEGGNRRVVIKKKGE